MSKPIPQGKPVEGNMAQALDGRFVNALTLQAALEEKGKDALEVTIDRVEYHDVLVYENGSKDQDCYLLYFKGSDKPLKLAKTNIRRIINQHGAIGSNWHGKKISLCLENDRRPDLGGKMGPCVRVARNIAKPTWGGASE